LPSPHSGSGSNPASPLPQTVWDTLTPTQQRNRRNTENKGDGGT
jgi:hypothetical protein